MKWLVWMEDDAKEDFRWVETIYCQPWQGLTLTFDIYSTLAFSSAFRNLKKERTLVCRRVRNLLTLAIFCRAQQFVKVNGGLSTSPPPLLPSSSCLSPNWSLLLLLFSCRDGCLNMKPRPSLWHRVFMFAFMWLSFLYWLNLAGVLVASAASLTPQWENEARMNTNRRWVRRTDEQDWCQLKWLFTLIFSLRGQMMIMICKQNKWIRALLWQVIFFFNNHSSHWSLYPPWAPRWFVTRHLPRLL